MPQNKLKDKSYINDFQTPENVGKYMVSLIPGGCVTILEPTPGMNQLVNELTGTNKGYWITAPADYWQLDKMLRFDDIVANLPFSSKTFLGNYIHG